MENHHFEWVNPLCQWQFSIVSCMFTRGWMLFLSMFFWGRMGGCTPHDAPSKSLGLPDPEDSEDSEDADPTCCLRAHEQNMIPGFWHHFFLGFSGYMLSISISIDGISNFYSAFIFMFFSRVAIKDEGKLMNNEQLSNKLMIFGMS